MQHLRSFFLFWYHFIIGDDWTIAATVVCGLVITFFLAHSRVVSWWLMPVIAISTLTFAVWRAARR